ncbi:hypothetical protein FI667_g1497, partial [Globisporangium splendens]
MMLATATAASSSTGLRKDERFVTIADAVAVVETFAEQTQARRVRIQQKLKDDADDGSAAAAVGDQADDANGAGGNSTMTASPGTSSSPSSSSSSSSQNIVVLECENAPECKWFVRLSYVKSEKKWKISSMNTTHHKTNCAESKPMSALATSTQHSGAFQRMIQDELMAAGNASNAAALLDPTTITSVGATTPASSGALGSHLYVGLMFMSWKEAISSIRALAQQMGRRVVAEKSTQMIFQGKSITVRRIVCQNHRNSNCEWMIVLDENQAGTDQYTVLSMHLLHSKECLETCNFNARKKEPAPAMKSAMTSSVSNAASGAFSSLSDSQMLGANNPSASLLVDDLSKYQLTHEMRWSTGKEATKAISDFTLVVQRKRSKLCKKNNGGSNKKYVCSDEKCLWFVQLVKGWKSKNWKISAMNLKHSDNCAGAPKPTARQLAEMRFFRQAVVTHSKSDGKLLTDTFLLNSESGIQIPRGMAYRAQRLVVATSTDDLTESYKFIPSLLDSFAKKNPGSTVSYEKDDQGHFVRAFLMPNAASLALLCMQQVYGIKLIHYDNVSYNGSLALLIGRDGNLKSHVLAFALMPNGEMEHMKWFLSMCKAGGVRFDGCPVFCSHNQNGLLRALAQEARNAKIMFCVRSLIDEIERDKNIPALGALEELIWGMQRQDTEEGFVKVMNQLESLNAAAAVFLRAVHPKNWAYYLNRSIRLYNWSSTQAEDAIMGSDVQFSDEAPFDLIYTFLAFLMDGIFKKSQLATKLLAETPLLTPGADALYRQELHESEAFTVRLCDEQVAFTWRTGARPKVTHRVDLSLRTCTCGQMYQLGIPCCHFIAVSLHFASEAALMDGFDPIYKATTYAEVNRNLRIEIPAAEDLHKDSTMLPAVSLKSTKYRKRARSSTTDPEESKLSSNANNSGDGGALLSKAPRLEFDTDVVTGLTELV